MEPRVEPLKVFSVTASDLKKSLEDGRTLFMMEGGVVRTGFEVEKIRKRRIQRILPACIGKGWATQTKL